MAGIAVAGTLVADVIKMISYYPDKGMLADISSESYGVGGCVSNTAVGVKMLDPSIEVKSSVPESATHLPPPIRGHV